MERDQSNNSAHQITRKQFLRFAIGTGAAAGAVILGNRLYHHKPNPLCQTEYGPINNPDVQQAIRANAAGIETGIRADGIVTPIEKDALAKLTGQLILNQQTIETCSREAVSNTLDLWGFALSLIGLAAWFPPISRSAPSTATPAPNK